MKKVDGIEFLLHTDNKNHLYFLLLFIYRDDKHIEMSETENGGCDLQLKAQRIKS